MEQVEATATPSVPAAAPTGQAAGLAAPRKIGSSLEGSQLFIDMMMQLRIGLSQSILYTIDTKQFEKARNNTYAALRSVLDYMGTIKLSLARGDALINGTRIDFPSKMRPTVEAVEKVLIAAGTSSLIFDKALAVEEFGPFLQMLARRQLPTGDSLHVNAALREQGLQNIQVDELRYVALGREQKIVSTDQPGLANHAAAQQAMTDLVDATLESIERIQDTEARVQLRSEFADQLIEKNEAMLPSLLNTALQRMKGADESAQSIAAALPKRDVALLNEALEAARMIRSEGGSTAPLGILRSLIEKLMHPYQTHAEDILAVMQIQRDDVEYLPEWLRKAIAGLQGETAAERLEAILRQSPAALLDSGMFQQIIDILDELSVAGLDTEAEQLMQHLAGALRLPTKKERGVAVERMASLLTRSIDQISKAVKLLEDALLETCTHETCDEVMKLLLDHLTQRSTHHYQLGNYQRAIEHLEWIVSLEESSRSALKDEGANLARITRENLSKTPFALSLLEELNAEGDRGAAAQRFAQLLGSGLVAGVLEAIKNEQDPARVDAFAQFLRHQTGTDAVRKLTESLEAETDPTRCVRLMSVLVKSTDAEQGWNTVQLALHHALAEVRAEALTLIMKRPPEIAARALATALQTDRDPERRAIWIKTLAHIKNPMAHPIILEVLDGMCDAPGECEAEITELLPAAAMPGQYAAVGVINKLLRPRSRSIASHTDGVSKELTLAAIKALGPFYKDINAAETLDRLRQSKDPDIARLALVCLRGIVAAEQQKDPAAPPSGIQSAVPQNPSASGSSASNPASISGSSPAISGRQSGTRGIRKGFEALAVGQVDEVFKVGRMVGATTSAQMQAVTPPLETPQIRPTLEGELANLGLCTTLRMAASRDGFMTVQNNEGEGRIYVRRRRVIAATYGALQNLDALSKMDEMRSGHFAFYGADYTVRDTMALEVDQLAEHISKHREKGEQDIYQDE